MASDCDGVASAVARKYLRLHLAENVGPIRLRRLLERFGDVDRLLSAGRSELERVQGVGRVSAEAVTCARSDERVDGELERAAALGLRVLCPEDAAYPAQLARIPDRPTCIYVRGDLCEEDSAALAIVGTRRCTRYGCEQSERFGALVAGAGFTVVSGLARGVDACAHRGALAAGGRTIAVLGNGLSEVYPPEHEELAGKVAEQGALISEVPLHVAPERGNFPQRNRIIVGLSVGVLVVEAPKGSGALITARLAAEYDREVFAIPGRIDTPQAIGTHRLIRDGAKLVTCLEDVLEELQAVKRKVVVSPTEGDSVRASEADAGVVHRELTSDERAILEAVGEEEASLDVICGASGLPVQRITSGLMSLQIKALVRQLPGNRYVRRRGSGSDATAR